MRLASIGSLSCLRRLLLSKFGRTLQRCLIPISRGFRFQLCLQLSEVKEWMISTCLALLILFCILVATTFPFFGNLWSCTTQE